MICADLFMTPTAELADIVLPAASWPEINQIAGLPTIAANVVLANQKAVRTHECKSDEEIFVELARRMKLPVCTEAVEEVLDAQLAAGGLGVTFDELKQRGFVNIPMKYRKFEDGGFRTPTGKIELYSTRLEQFGYFAPALLCRSSGNPDQRPPGRRGFPADPDHGRTHFALLQFGTPSDRNVAQGAPRPSRRDPSGHRREIWHFQRRLDVD